MLKWFMYSFPDSGSFISNEIIKLHDYVMMILLGVLMVLLYLMVYMMMNYSLNRSMIHGHLLEVIWTIIPMVLLLFVAFPSLKLLYKMDDLVDDCKLTVKVLGNQWFWSYEVEDLCYVKKIENFLNKEIEKSSSTSIPVTLMPFSSSLMHTTSSWFNKEKVKLLYFSLKKGIISSYMKDFYYKEMDSYMISSELLEKGGFRLLDVDNRLVLPMNMNMRFLVTSNDVIHSWAVPGLGIKIDAVPGRLNQVQINMNKAGLFFGQCSEICGVNHSFMPIVIESVPLKMYLSYFLDKFDYKYIKNRAENMYR